MPTISPTLLPVLMLFASNVFMTFAWYGHLKYKDHSLVIVILASWGIAFFEYTLMVPANRWGYGQFTVVQLKTIQEIVTLTVFCGFATLYIGESLRWNHLVAFALLIAAAYFMFRE